MHSYGLQTRIIPITATVAPLQKKQQFTQTGITALKEYGLRLLQREFGIRAITMDVGVGYLDIGRKSIGLVTGDKTNQPC
jgi:hypothetical protein